MNSANDFYQQIKITKLTHFISSLSYKLNKNTAIKLAKNNLKLINHLLLLSDEDLETIYGFDQNQIKEINTKIKNTPININAITGIQLGQDTKYIKSGSQGFDYIFGQGFPTGRLTQIFGEAGVGKSQLCFQLCFKVQLQEEEGGLNGEALYFDTENSFRPERICEIAYNYYKNRSLDKNLLKFKTEEILTRIHVRNVKTNADDLYNIIVNGQLDSFLDLHSSVRLFILDSLAYHFRYSYEYDNHTRIQQLLLIGKKLKQIAYERNISVLITNQVKLANEPALGDLWNATCSTSLHLRHLSRNKEQFNQSDLSSHIVIKSVRQCFVVKSPIVKYGFSFKYLINELGIVDYHCENSQ